jgi:hypothetical protein
MRNTIVLVVPALVLVTACSHSSTSSSGGGTVAGKQPIDVAALARRESTDLQPVQVAAPDGALSFTVDAKGQPKLLKQPDGSFVLSVPIGSGQDVQCVVGAPPDLSSTTLVHRQGVEKFPEREITEIDAGELGGAAFIATRTFYFVDNNGVRTVGELKTAAAHRGVNVGAACVHDEVGYGQTLRRVVRSIVESIKVADAKADPIYREIAVIKLRDKPIGVIETSLIAGKDGNLWTFESSSMMVPTTPKDVLGRDEFTAESMGKNGEVQRAIYVGMQNAGESQFEINLEREKGGYHAKGKFQGKAVDAKIAAKAGLPSSLRTAQLTRELVAGKRRELVMAHYSPSTDPLTFGTHKVTPSGDKELPFREEDNDLSALSAYDGDGLTVRGRMSMGPLSLDFSRVAQYGHWPKAR